MRIASSDPSASQTVLEPNIKKRGRGRPPGSKNKKARKDENSCRRDPSAFEHAIARSTGNIVSSRRCTKCKMPGHNKRSCSSVPSKENRYVVDTESEVDEDSYQEMKTKVRTTLNLKLVKTTRTVTWGVKMKVRTTLNLKLAKITKEMTMRLLCIKLPHLHKGKHSKTRRFHTTIKNMRYKYQQHQMLYEFAAFLISLMTSIMIQALFATMEAPISSLSMAGVLEVRLIGRRH